MGAFRGFIQPTHVVYELLIKDDDESVHVGKMARSVRQGEHPSVGEIDQ